jgi:hypothetical protein
MDLRLQRVGAWCGIVMLVLFGICFMLIGGLVPPLSPTSSAQQIAQYLVDHKLRVRLGVALSLLVAPMALPWLAVICLRIRRIEGKWGMLAVTELFAAVVFVPGFVFPLMVLGAAAYRPEHRSPEVTQALDDVFWLMFIGIVGIGVLQALVIAAAAFLDGTDPPTFPRWFAYLNIWFALLGVPGGAVVLFNDGPLAWNGIFAFWIPLTAFFIWVIAVTVVMLRSISAQAAAENRVLAPAA